MQSVFKQYMIEMKLYLRQPIYLLFSLLMPILSYLFFGGMYAGADYGANDFYSLYIPGFCMLILYSSSVFNIGNQIVTDKEKGIYKRILVTPISIVRFVGVILAKAFTIAVLGFLGIMAISKFYFKVPVGTDQLVFIGAYMVFIVFALSIGVGIAVLSKRINTYSTIMMVMFFPMFMLSDAAVPVNYFPEWAQRVADFNPLYHANKVLRFFWSETTRQTMSEGIVYSFAFLLLIGVAIYTVIGIRWRKLSESI